MKLTDFVNQYNGKYLSVLNPGKQCFDIPVKWSDLLGIPHFPGNPSPFPYINAHEIFTKYGSFQQQHFDRITNAADNKPQEGDIVVWAGSYNGGIGHVAVATGVGNYSSFEAFSQNDPTGSVCIKRMYNYNHVLGWLRPKKYQITSSPQPTMDNRPYLFDLIKNSTISFDWKTDDSKKVTEGTVRDFIVQMNSRGYRAGVLDGFTRLVGYQSDTNQLTPQSLFEIAKEFFKKQFTPQDIKTKILALIDKLKQEVQQV